MMKWLVVGGREGGASAAAAACGCQEVDQQHVDPLNTSDLHLSSLSPFTQPSWSLLCCDAVAGMPSSVRISHYQENSSGGNEERRGWGGGSNLYIYLQ